MTRYSFLKCCSLCGPMSCLETETQPLLHSERRAKIRNRPPRWRTHKAFTDKKGWKTSYIVLKIAHKKMANTKHLDILNRDQTPGTELWNWQNKINIFRPYCYLAIGVFTFVHEFMWQYRIFKKKTQLKIWSVWKHKHRRSLTLSLTHTHTNPVKAFYDCFIVHRF